VKHAEINSRHFACRLSRHRRAISENFMRLYEKLAKPIIYNQIQRPRRPCSPTNVTMSIHAHEIVYICIKSVRCFGKNVWYRRKDAEKRYNCPPATIKLAAGENRRKSPNKRQRSAANPTGQKKTDHRIRGRSPYTTGSDGWPCASTPTIGNSRMLGARCLTDRRLGAETTGGMLAKSFAAPSIRFRVAPSFQPKRSSPVFTSDFSSLNGIWWIVPAIKIC